MTTIKLKNGSGAPAASDLAQGEPALDLTNKRLYTEDSGGNVIEVGTNPGVDVTFADNRKAIFGAGSDLQIYHDGSHSYIEDAGTGNLRIDAQSFQIRKQGTTENMAGFAADGAVTLYYDNSVKLATTSTGIDVTGNVDASGVAQIGGSTDLLYLSGKTGTHAYVSLGGSSTAADFFIGADTAIPLIFRTDATERMRIDSSGNVGIGTASPDADLHISGTGNDAKIILEGTSNPRGNFIAVEGADDLVFAADEDNLGASSAMKFRIDASECMRIDSSGHLIVPNGVTLGTAVDTYAAANTLDDYEEGTFTPSLNAFTGTLSRQVGRYTKVGNLVTAFVHLDVSVTGGSGDLIITGLPFTAANVSFHYGSVSSLHCANWSTTTKPDGALINPNTTNAPLYKSQGQVGVVAPTLSDLGTGNILGVFVYETA